MCCYDKIFVNVAAYVIPGCVCVCVCVFCVCVCVVRSKQEHKSKKKKRNQYFHQQIHLIKCYS